VEGGARPPSTNVLASSRCLPHPAARTVPVPAPPVTRVPRRWRRYGSASRRAQG